MHEIQKRFQNQFQSVLHQKRHDGVKVIKQSGTLKDSQSGTLETLRGNHLGTLETSKHLQLGTSETPKDHMYGNSDTFKDRQSGTSEPLKEGQLGTSETLKDNWLGTSETLKDNWLGTSGSLEQGKLGSSETPTDRKLGTSEILKDSQSDTTKTLKDSKLGISENPEDIKLDTPKNPKDSQLGTSENPKDSQLGTSDTSKDHKLGSPEAPKDRLFDKVTNESTSLHDPKLSNSTNQASNIISDQAAEIQARVQSLDVKSKQSLALEFIKQLKAVLRLDGGTDMLSPRTELQHEFLQISEVTSSEVVELKDPRNEPKNGAGTNEDLEINSDVDLVSISSATNENSDADENISQNSMLDGKVSRKIRYEIISDDGDTSQSDVGQENEKPSKLEDCIGVTTEEDEPILGLKQLTEGKQFNSSVSNYNVHEDTISKKAVSSYIVASGDESDISNEVVIGGDEDAISNKVAYSYQVPIRYRDTISNDIIGNQVSINVNLTLSNRDTDNNANIISNKVANRNGDIITDAVPERDATNYAKAINSPKSIIDDKHLKSYSDFHNYSNRPLDTAPKDFEAELHTKATNGKLTIPDREQLGMSPPQAESRLVPSTLRENNNFYNVTGHTLPSFPSSKPIQWTVRQAPPERGRHSTSQRHIPSRNLPVSLQKVLENHSNNKKSVGQRSGNSLGKESLDAEDKSLRKYSCCLCKAKFACFSRLRRHKKVVHNKVTSIFNDYRLKDSETDTDTDSRPESSADITGKKTKVAEDDAGEKSMPAKVIDNFKPKKNQNRMNHGHKDDDSHSASTPRSYPGKTEMNDCLRGDEKSNSSCSNGTKKFLPSSNDKKNNSTNRNDREKLLPSSNDKKVISLSKNEEKCISLPSSMKKNTFTTNKFDNVISNTTPVQVEPRIKTDVPKHSGRRTTVEKTENNLYKCKLCDATFITSFGEMQHVMRRHSKGSSNPPPKDKLQNQAPNLLGDQLDNSNSSEELSIQDWVLNQRETGTESPQCNETCNECGDVFNSLEQQRYHMLQEHGLEVTFENETFAFFAYESSDLVINSQTSSSRDRKRPDSRKRSQPILMKRGPQSDATIREQAIPLKRKGPSDSFSSSFAKRKADSRVQTPSSENQTNLDPANDLQLSPSNNKANENLRFKSVFLDTDGFYYDKNNFSCTICALPFPWWKNLTTHLFDCHNIIVPGRRKNDNSDDLEKSKSSSDASKERSPIATKGVNAVKKKNASKGNLAKLRQEALKSFPEFNTAKQKNRIKIRKETTGGSATCNEDTQEIPIRNANKTKPSFTDKELRKETSENVSECNPGNHDQSKDNNSPIIFSNDLTGSKSTGKITWKADFMRKKFFCLTCDYEFSGYFILKKHLTERHDITVDPRGMQVEKSLTTSTSNKKPTGNKRASCIQISSADSDDSDDANHGEDEGMDIDSAEPAAPIVKTKNGLYQCAHCKSEFSSLIDRYIHIVDAHKNAKKSRNLDLSHTKDSKTSDNSDAKISGSSYTENGISDANNEKSDIADKERHVMNNNVDVNHEISDNQESRLPTKKNDIVCNKSQELNVAKADQNSLMSSVGNNIILPVKSNGVLPGNASKVFYCTVCESSFLSQKRVKCHLTRFHNMSYDDDKSSDGNKTDKDCDDEQVTNSSTIKSSANINVVGKSDSSDVTKHHSNDVTNRDSSNLKKRDSSDVSKCDLSDVTKHDPSDVTKHDSIDVTKRNLSDVTKPNSKITTSKFDAVDNKTEKLQAKDIYKCSKCDKAFSVWSDKRHHMQSVHRIKLPANTARKSLPSKKPQRNSESVRNPTSKEKTDSCQTSIVDEIPKIQKKRRGSQNSESSSRQLNSEPGRSSSKKRKRDRTSKSNIESFQYEEHVDTDTPISYTDVEMTICPSNLCKHVREKHDRPNKPHSPSKTNSKYTCEKSSENDVIEISRDSSQHKPNSPGKARSAKEKQSKNLKGKAKVKITKAVTAPTNYFSNISESNRSYRSMKEWGIHNGQIRTEKMTHNPKEQSSTSEHKQKSPQIHRCEICSEEFLDRSLLLRHKLGNCYRKFTCAIPGCEKGFSSRSSYDAHMLNTCTLCHSQLSSENGLRKHYKFVHKIKTILRCDLCEEEFLEPVSLAIHNREKHWTNDR